MFSVAQRLKRLRKKCVRKYVQKGPGLKPLDFAGDFAGLKPCAPTEKHDARIFPQLEKPFASAEKHKTWIFSQPVSPRSVLGEESAKAEALAYPEAKRRWMTRWTAATMVCLLAVVMLGATPGSRFNRVGHEMMCACGCGQVLLECNHVGCPDSDRMIGELRTQIAGGGSDTAILTWFSTKYGPTILAAPIRGGFDDVAWIMPMAVFLLAIVGTGFLVVIWKRRTRGDAVVAAGVPDPAAADAMRERIRRETEY